MQLSAGSNSASHARNARSESKYHQRLHRKRMRGKTFGGSAEKNILLRKIPIS